TAPRGAKRSCEGKRDDDDDSNPPSRWREGDSGSSPKCYQNQISLVPTTEKHISRLKEARKEGTTTVIKTTSTKIKKQQENDAKLAKATTTLQQIADSNITPRNIRKIVKDSILMLQDPK